MGTAPDHIIDLALDDIANIEYRDAMKLYTYVKSSIKDTSMHYVFLD